jgi:hypothetical protein
MLLFPDRIWKRGEWVQHDGYEDILPLNNLND